MDADESLTWATLPEPALIRIFANLPVTSILRHAYRINQAWNSVMTSNEVWRQRYHQLRQEESLNSIIQNNDQITAFVRNGFFVNPNAPPSMIWPKQRRFPPNFFFIEFLRIWTLVPHVWFNSDRGLSSYAYYAMQRRNSENQFWQGISENARALYLWPFESYSEWTNYWSFDANKLTLITVIGDAPSVSILRYIPTFGLALQIRNQPIAVGATRPAGTDFEITQGFRDNHLEWEVNPSNNANANDNRVEVPHLVLFLLQFTDGFMEFWSMYADPTKPERWIKTPLVWIHQAALSPNDLMASEISCGNCKALSPAVRCGGNCGSILYCNQDCANAHWETHACNKQTK